MLGASDERVIAACGRYHFLTAQQVCRLFYRRGSRSYVQSKLKWLTDCGYFQRLFLPRASQHGSSPSVYTLARKGIRFLKSCGVLGDMRYRPSETREHSYLFLSHTLAVSDLLISVECLCRSVRGIELHRMLHERALKRSPVYVTDEAGGRFAVVPDGFVELRLNDYQVCLVFEVDRGTEGQKRWRRKIRGLLDFANGPYQNRFQTNSLTIATVALPGKKRLADLMKWTEAEMEDDGLDVADLFRLTSLNPVKTSPEVFFLSSCWHKPFDQTPLPLMASRRSGLDFDLLESEAIRPLTTRSSTVIFKNDSDL